MGDTSDSPIPGKIPEWSSDDEGRAGKARELAGTGALLLVIAQDKRPLRDSRLPAVTFSEGGAAIVQRITF